MEQGREELRKLTQSVLVRSDSIEDVIKITGVRQLCITVAKYQTQATYGIKSFEFTLFKVHISEFSGDTGCSYASVCAPRGRNEQRE